MARTTERKFFVAGAVGDTGYDADNGGDTYRIHEAVTGATDNTATQLVFTSTTAATKVFDPKTNTSSSLATDEYGWIFNREAASPHSFGAESNLHRVIPAGVWLLEGRVTCSAPATLASYDTQLTANCYRVSATNVPTFLFAFPLSAAISTTSLTGAQTVAFSINSASQPEYVFEEDETFLIAVQCRSAATSAVLGSTTDSTVSLHINSDPDNLRLTVPAPGIRTRYLEPHAANMTLAAALRRTIGKPQSAPVNFVAAFGKTVSAHRSFSAPITLAADLTRTIVKAPFSAAITLASSIRKTVAVTRQSGITLAAELTRAIRKTPFADSIILSPAFNKLVQARKSFSAAITLGVVFKKRLLARRSFSPVLVLGALLRVCMPQSVLNRLEGGGGSTTIIYPINVFDD